MKGDHILLLARCFFHCGRKLAPRQGSEGKRMDDRQLSRCYDPPLGQSKTSLIASSCVEHFVSIPKTYLTRGNLPLVFSSSRNHRFVWSAPCLGLPVFLQPGKSFLQPAFHCPDEYWPSGRSCGHITLRFAVASRLGVVLGGCVLVFDCQVRGISLE